MPSIVIVAMIQNYNGILTSHNANRKKEQEQKLRKVVIIS